ncbi:hypothetical protein BASA81_007933 [Batrachochytrium salamandrivorans]|nr:hypothetical protein BASA81_007933 [Batrachochytrium salamandrivorans]
METIELYVLTHSCKFFEQIELTSKSDRFLLHPPSSGFLFGRKQRVDFRKQRESTFALRHVLSLDNIPQGALVIADARALIEANGRPLRLNRTWVLVVVETNEDAKQSFLQRHPAFKRENVMIEDDLKLHVMLDVMVLKQIARGLNA